MIMSEWKTYKLGEIAEIKNGKTRPKFEGEIAVYGGNGILGYANEFNTEDETIIIGRVGANCGSVFFETQRIWVSDNAMYAKAKKNFDSKFLYYLLKNSNLNKYAEGSSHPLLTQRLLNDLVILAPDLPTQRQIAQILSSLDDKIELNLQMNQTLEAIAQAIFKEWFVNFNFPSSELGLEGLDDNWILDEKEKNEILKSSNRKNHNSDNGLPKGWRMGKLGEEFNLIMGQSPPGTSYNEIGKGMVFYQGRTDFGFRFPTNRFYTTEPKRIAKPLDTLVSVRAPVGDINMANESCCIGRGLSSVRHKSNAYSYTYYMMKSLEPILKGFEGEGTVFGSINKSNFENIEVYIPSKEIISEFETFVNPIDDKNLENTNQIQTLTQFRDTLLPKLMSGQIEVAR